MEFNVETIKALYIYACRFKGRATRTEFWGFNLISIVIVILAWVFSALPGIDLLVSIFAVILFLPTIAVGIRRLHDGNRTGLLIFLGAIPFVGWLILVYFNILPGTKGKNQHGPDPRDNRKPGFQLYDTDLFKDFNKD